MWPYKQVCWHKRGVVGELKPGICRGSAASDPRDQGFSKPKLPCMCLVDVWAVCFLWAALNVWSFPVSQVSQLAPVCVAFVKLCAGGCECSPLQWAPVIAQTLQELAQPCSLRIRLTSAHFRFKDVLCNCLKKKKKRNRWKKRLVM